MADFKPEKYEDYIDLYGILLTIKREIKLFTFIFILISLVGFIKTKSSKPIWKATFQIVASDSSANSFSSEGRFQGLLNVSNINMSKDLQTEVKILKSPIILMPAFNRFKNNFPQEANNLTYKDWVSNIGVELQPGTTVLQAAFFNENKDLLIPSLNEISQEYQNYSKRDQKRRFENTLNYLNNQIDYYQEKSKLSLEKAQTYAIDFYLTPLTGESDIDKEIQSSFFSNNNSSINLQDASSTPINIELERLLASNEKKIYETKLKQLKTINDEDTLFLLGKTEEFMSKSDIIYNIESKNIEIERLQSLFTQNDPILQAALRTKKLYLNTFKNELKGFFNAKLLDAEARLKASERPEGVLVTYKELLRKSKRDEEFLNKLELDRQLLLLEESMIIEPWELISNPTILDNPVSRSKKTIFLIWSFMGILIAGLVTLIKEYKSDLIFSKQRIISLLNLKLLAILETADDEKNWSKEIILPLNEQEIEKLKKVNINLISLGNIKNNNKKKIFTIFNDNFKKFTECDVDNLDKNGLNILIIEKGKIKKNEITRFLDKIKIYNLDIEYWILID